MRVYQCTTMIEGDVSYAEFAQLFGGAITEGSGESFLLIRDDGARLQVVADAGMLMLCLVLTASDYRVSFGSTYVDAPRQFRGLFGMCEANDENFVDPSFAMQAVNAFIHGRPMSDFVDFRHGCPDRGVLSFPEPIKAEIRVERKLIEQRVELPEGLRSDMRSVCDYLEEAADDPDENIDFDDAIQIGAVCGGRIDERADTYAFSYYLPSGDRWNFQVPRDVLEGIADGSIRKLTVLASVPK